MSTLWHGRFETGPAEELVAFTESLSYDQRLLFDDIRCSKGHVRGLRRGGLLSEEELGLVLGFFNFGAGGGAFFDLAGGLL